MTITQEILTVGAVVLGTMTTRFLPFIIFPANKPIPKYIQYLGRVLPFSVIGMLIIYCLKDVSFITNPFALPEIIAILGIVTLHKWQHSMLLSISGGTILYMLLVQFIFN
ncbi:branched-chain amino acid transporter permease [Fusobacterium varium]|jgi:branched-subunit amino acid transport protein AzlD|nr:branched-chain amino acid transporter permease [Fusobacterium varium]